MRSAFPVMAFALLLSAHAARADGADLAWKAVREHRLLSARQLSCVYLLEREGSTGRSVRVGVYETHDKRCGGDPRTSHRLFDLELDRRTGKIRWDNNLEQEMRPVSASRQRR